MIFKNSSLEIAANYDYLILDVWGVIHDGTTAYPLVLERLKALRQMGKKICFLSNAPRRASKVANVLASYGITAEFYDFILTSGEATYYYLENNQRQNFTTHGSNYFYVGPQKDIYLLNGLNYQMTEASQASFIIATGFEGESSTLEEKMPQLREAIKYNLPMICVNPDMIVVKQNGAKLICAGYLAGAYKEMGGEVIYFGKPYDLVYKQVMDLFSITNKSKVLAIGDGLETDILGAKNFNIDSALIPGGILSGSLKIKYGQLPKSDDLDKICQEYKIYPQFVIAGL